jgi:hypothetical protein
MVKVNLMDVPERQKPSGEKKQDSSESETTKSKVDLPFFPDREEKPSADTETKNPFFDDESPKRSEPRFTDESFKSDYDENPPGFDSNISRNRMIIILGAIGIVLLLLFIFLWLGPGGDGSEDVPDKTLTTPGETGSSEEGTGSTMPDYMQAQFRQNQAMNQSYSSFARNLLNVSSANAAYKMIVLTTGYLYMSVLGDSRNAIAEFRNMLRGQYPGTQINIESIQDKYVNGEKKILADFSFPIASAGSGGSSSALPQTGGSSGDTRSLINSYVQKHNLRAPYFQQGGRKREGQFQKTHYYVIVKGNQSSILNFLQEISQTRPEVNFTKISIYTSNSYTIDKRNVNARIELTSYNPA